LPSSPFSFSFFDNRNTRATGAGHPRPWLTVLRDRAYGPRTGLYFFVFVGLAGPVLKSAGPFIFYAKQFLAPIASLPS